MAFSNFKLSSYIPLIAGIVLAFGVGVTVVALQQQQETRSRAENKYREVDRDANFIYYCFDSEEYIEESHSCKYCGKGLSGAIGSAVVGCVYKNAMRSRYSNGGSESTLTGPEATFDGNLQAVCTAVGGTCSKNATSCPSSSDKKQGYCYVAPNTTNGKYPCCIKNVSTKPPVAINGNGGPECGRDGCCSDPKKGGYSGGKCQYTNTSCPGNFVPSNVWLCPRGDNYRCCKPKTSTPPPSTGATKIALDLLLHGIGKAGDSVNPGSAGGGNMDPKEKTREVTVGIYTTQNQLVVTKKANVTLNSTSGSFKGEVDLGSSFKTGSYIVKIKFSQSLDTQVAGAPTITAGKTNNIPQTSLVTGDINNDGFVSLNIQDYNMLLTCLTTSCSAEQKNQADLDDDDDVDQFDYNLFIRELSHIN